ncbi:phosphoadenosine phosphosulfate reductase family protein [Methanocaldococcus sp.]|uniref:phosphoadenosine phosphosulfate reductase domain-containing protein n=1 Tax=Methanocaldococcus sp. TaxID=2152917 RepID=UPI00262D6805|nr:phosphoadenosine phosphosulfate reductase family protein [Methanocaldococcus sp.]MCQ6254827.1 phosphoadenosine phosphosulfate reductase family protein [Methanocaldococcus sp.]
MDDKFTSKFEIDILNKLLNKNFNYDLAIILKKIGGLDYRKKVFIGGECIGILEFDLIDLDWKFHPYASYYLIEEPKIKLKPTKRKLKGKKVPINLIVNPEELKDINENEYVGVEIGNYVGVGIKKGETIKIKDLTLKKEIKFEKIEEYLRKNYDRIKKLEKKSLNIIEKYYKKCKDKGYVINASFSGGKDSSVSTLLANKVIDDLEVIFIDTGLEFKETIKFVKKFAKEYDINLVILRGKDFWEYLGKFGIPTKDYRWCNSICKLEPLKEYLKKYKKVYTIDGSRKYESFTRSKLEYERKSSFIENQINIFPILDWKGTDVWSWIYLNDVMYNELYDKGFERIGCFMCPSALNSEFLRVKELYPELFNKWVEVLKRFGYSEDEILRGFWRWKKLPPKMKELKKLLQYLGT